MVLLMSFLLLWAASKSTAVHLSTSFVVPFGSNGGFVHRPLRSLTVRCVEDGGGSADESSIGAAPSLIRIVDDPPLASRRSVVAFLASIAPSILANPSVAAQDAATMGTANRPVAVLGGGGRTGMAVAETLAAGIGGGRRMHALTMTRSGKDPFQIVRLPPDVKELVRHCDRPVDVRHMDALLAALREANVSAIVFAASASKQGGNAFDVDDEGVGNAARAAKELGVRLVVVSSLALDRPESKSYQITNTIGGYLDKIMDAKRNGEDKVRSILGNGTGDYIIVRPGVLLSGKTKNGPLDIELNQGDTIGGGLSRDELAGVVVGALQCNKKSVTVEAYRRSTRTKLQPDFTSPSGNELTSTTFVGLFDAAKIDS